MKQELYYEVMKKLLTVIEELKSIKDDKIAHAPLQVLGALGLSMSNYKFPSNESPPAKNLKTKVKQNNTQPSFEYKNDGLVGYKGKICYLRKDGEQVKIFPISASKLQPAPTILSVNEIVADKIRYIKPSNINSLNKMKAFIMNDDPKTLYQETMHNNIKKSITEIEAMGADHPTISELS